MRKRLRCCFGDVVVVEEEALVGMVMYIWNGGVGCSCSQPGEQHRQAQVPSIVQFVTGTGKCVGNERTSCTVTPPRLKYLFLVEFQAWQM